MDAWILLAGFEIEAHDYASAYAHAQLAHKARPSSGLPLTALAVAAFSRNAPGPALRHLHTAMTVDPGSAAAYLIYGCQLAQHERTADTAWIYVRRAEAAAGTFFVFESDGGTRFFISDGVTRCAPANKWFGRARWWITTLGGEYDPRHRELSRRVAARPLLLPIPNDELLFRSAQGSGDRQRR